MRLAALVGFGARVRENEPESLGFYSHLESSYVSLISEPDSNSGKLEETYNRLGNPLTYCTTVERLHLSLTVHAWRLSEAKVELKHCDIFDIF